MTTPPAPAPAAPAPTAPAPTRGRKLLLLAGILAFVPVGQVLAARWIDPWYTWTMLERAWEHRADDDGRWFPDYRPMPLDELGRHVPRAAVASEDGWFFHHPGFDCLQIKDALADAAAGRGSRGASTISQQVARNVFLWQERSWLRKGLEAGYTALLELLVPKERILELYLSVAETGPMTFGFEAGAWRWFNKPASELTADEAARLVAILPSPQKWTPDSESSRRRARQINDQRVPFPGDPGFDAMVEQAPSCLWIWFED